MLHALSPLVVSATLLAKAPIAIVTGGTRGIGRGIAEALASRGTHLLLTYNTDADAAEHAAEELREAHDVGVMCVGGDLALETTRDDLFASLDTVLSTHDLIAVVHNAGQYVGVTSQNAADLGPANGLGFGDGSLLDIGGRANLEAMHYYQRLYGDAYVDLCERGLARMSTDGGSLVGISSPGCTQQYKPNLGYDMPGSGKCIMEYAMRLIALRCAGSNVNCNVVVPGVTATQAWDRLAERRGYDDVDLAETMASRLSPMGLMQPRDVGEVVAFLCSAEGRWITGLSLPADGGVHLRT